MRRLLLLPLLALLAGCEGAAFTLVNAPTAFGPATVTRDIAYGAKPWQKLDIYVPPTGPLDAKRDTIVFFYGGRWKTGSRRDYRFVGEAFAKMGFVTVIPDYSKYPAVRFPAFIEDGAKALAWVHDNVAGYRGEPRRIHVAGHSAGAHTGALLAADKRYLAAVGKSPGQVIASFAGLAGPYSFTPDEPDLEDIFGPPSRYPAMQVTSFIEGREPPMLLLWGDADVTVKRYNLDRLQAAIEAKGGRVRSIVYRGADHISVLGALSWLNTKGHPVREDLARFFREAGAGR